MEKHGSFGNFADVMRRVGRADATCDVDAKLCAVASIATAIEEQAAVTKDVASNIGRASKGLKSGENQVSQTARVSGSIAQEIAALRIEVTEILDGGAFVEASGDLEKDNMRPLSRAEKLPMIWSVPNVRNAWS